MHVRTPSAERVCSAAVSHFARRGYDAASLAEIAAAVGIRKPSLYAHFPGKDALFMAVFDDALSIEMAFARQCFTEEPVSALPGSGYCRQLADRYLKSEHLRFLLRTAYLPPEGLRTEIDTGYVRYLDQLGDDFEQRLRVWAGGRALAEDTLRFYRQAYLGIADSLHVKLIYTNTQEAQERLAAMLGLLSESLAKHRGH